MLTKDEIKRYLEINLLDDLKLDEVSDDAKFAVLAKLADVVYLRFINALTERLTDADTDTLEDMLERGAVNEFETFLSEKVPDYQEIFDQIVAEEKRNLLEKSQEILAA